MIARAVSPRPALTKYGDIAGGQLQLIRLYLIFLDRRSFFFTGTQHYEVSADLS